MEFLGSKYSRIQSRERLFITIMHSGFVVSDVEFGGGGTGVSSGQKETRPSSHVPFITF